MQNGKLQSCVYCTSILLEPFCVHIMLEAICMNKPCPRVTLFMLKVYLHRSNLWTLEFSISWKVGTKMQTCRYWEYHFIPWICDLSHNLAYTTVCVLTITQAMPAITVVIPNSCTCLSCLLYKQCLYLGSTLSSPLFLYSPENKQVSSFNFMLQSLMGNWWMAEGVECIG